MGAGQRSSPFSSIFPPTILPQVDDYIKEGYADEMETRVRGTALILQASATAAAAETAIDLLSRIASYAVVAPAQRNKRPLKRPGANGPKRVPGGPRLKPCSCGQGKPHKNSNYKGCANYKGKGQVEGAPGGAPGGGSSSSSSSSVSSSAKAQTSCRGKNCSATTRPKQGMYCKDCKGATNFICSHWLCVANGKEVGHDTGVRYGDPCPNHCVTCATATCRRKITASAATRGTHSHKLCDACRPQRVRRRGRRKTHGRRFINNNNNLRT